MAVSRIFCQLLLLSTYQHLGIVGEGVLKLVKVNAPILRQVGVTLCGWSEGDGFCYGTEIFD